MTNQPPDKRQPRTYQGVLYLTPEGLQDQTGSMVMSAAELLAGLGSSPSAREERAEECAYWYCQISASSNRTLERDHVLSVIGKRLRELAPTHPLAPSHVEAQVPPKAGSNAGAGDASTPPAPVASAPLPHEPAPKEIRIFDEPGKFSKEFVEAARPSIATTITDAYRGRKVYDRILYADMLEHLEELERRLEEALIHAGKETGRAEAAAPSSTPEQLESDKNWLRAQRDVAEEKLADATLRAVAAEKALEYNLGIANKTARSFQAERDIVIRELRKKYSAIEIAEMVGLTRQRIHQILNEAPVEYDPANLLHFETAPPSATRLPLDVLIDARNTIFTPEGERDHAKAIKTIGALDELIAQVKATDGGGAVQKEKP